MMTRRICQMRWQDSAYGECEGGSPEERRRRIANLISSAAAPEVPDDFEQVRPLLCRGLRQVMWKHGTMADPVHSQ